MVFISSEYLQEVFQKERFSLILERAVCDLQEYEREVPFDSIAFCGMSGAALAYPLSPRLDKSLLCVRKKGEVLSHSWDSVEGNLGSQSYIIVDDFVDTGSTLVRIENTISECSLSARCVGVYLYKQDQYTCSSGTRYIERNERQLRYIPCGKVLW